MSVVSLGILLVNAVYVVVVVVVAVVVAAVLEEDVAAVPDTAGVQVMVAGVTVPVEDLQDVAVCHLVGVALVDHLHTVVERRYLMPTEMA